MKIYDNNMNRKLSEKPENKTNLINFIKTYDKKIVFIVVISLLLCLLIQHPLMAKAKNNGNAKPDSWGIYVNDKEIKLKETISKNNKLYVPLREFCEKLNMKVEWVPIHSLTYGGAKPVGINITNPTFIYTDRINVYENEVEKSEIGEQKLAVEIIEYLKDKKYQDAKKLVLENNAVDIAEIIEEIIDEISIEKAVVMYRMLPKDISVEVFSYLPVEDQVNIINVITDKEVGHIIEELSFDDMIDVLEELPANIVDKILEKTPKGERKLINTFLNYPENSAGSLMTIDYISLRKDMTVSEALSHIKSVGMDSETVYTCYVKDNERKLRGIVSLRTLVVSEKEELILNVMREDMIYVNVYDDQEDVSELFKKYGFLAMPVVDKEGRLVGIITIDDILDVIDEEVTEDFERMAGVIDSSDQEYLDISVWKHVKNRMPWLFLLMCSYMITGSIIQNFENVLSNVIALVTYMPMLMGTGGNSGSQSATLVIRGMALDEIELSDAFRVLWKEIRISTIIGISLSTLNFARIYWFDGQSALIAMTVSVSMLVIVIAAKSIGSMLPMIAKRVGIDPALVASPMISSLTDMVSVVTYFLLATAILNL